MSWQEYVARHAAGRSQVALADLVDVSQTAVSRWLRGAQGVDATVAIRFARAVDDEPLTALVEAGYLTLEEAGATPAERPDYSRLTNDELLELIRSRMREDGESHDETSMSGAEGTSATGVSTEGTGGPVAGSGGGGSGGPGGSEPTPPGIQWSGSKQRRPRTRGKPAPGHKDDGRSGGRGTGGGDQR